MDEIMSVACVSKRGYPSVIMTKPYFAKFQGTSGILLVKDSWQRFLVFLVFLVHDFLSA